MKSADIIYRAYSNMKRSKSRSRRTIISISIGLCSILTMISLFIGADDVAKKFSSETNKLLTVVISGVTLQGDNSILPTMQGSASRLLNNSDVDFLKNNLKEYTTSSFGKSILPDIKVGILGNYVFRTNAVGVDYSTLSEGSFKYLKGNNIKDVKGAIVSKSFISHALLAKDWDSGTHNNMQTVDVLGKEIEFKVIIVNMNGDKRVNKEVKIPVRIDGILDDDNQYFGDTGSIDDVRDPNTIFDKSVIYLPIERIEAIQTNFKAENNLIYQRVVTLNINNINNMEGALNELRKNNFSISSEYDNYELIKYLSFTLRLIFGTLGLLISLTAIIGIVNTMIISVLERTKDIGIFKAIGTKLKYIKLIYITEATFIGLLGGFIGAVGSLVIIKAINLIANINMFGLRTGRAYITVARLPLYISIVGITVSCVISVAACIPCLIYISSLKTVDALK